MSSGLYSVDDGLKVRESTSQGAHSPTLRKREAETEASDARSVLFGAGHAVISYPLAPRPDRNDENNEGGEK